MGIPGCAFNFNNVTVSYFFLGDPELVTAFRFIGIEGTSVRDAAEAASAFKYITENQKVAYSVKTNLSGVKNCKVLILTEEIAFWLDELLVQWQLSGQYPLIVEIPGIMGKMPNRKTLIDSIREAIGIHV